MGEVADDAIEHYSDDRFWDEVNRDFESWTPQQWRAYRKEFKEWEAFAGEALPPEVLADDWSTQLTADATPRVGQLT